MALFYKEWLTNIIRHSGATRVVTRLTATPRGLRLAVTDDGHGLVAGPWERPGGHRVPDSLRRRARLLGGRVAAHDGPESGTCISLTLSTISWWKPSWQRAVWGAGVRSRRGAREPSQTG